MEAKRIVKIMDAMETEYPCEKRWLQLREFVTRLAYDEEVRAAQLPRAPDRAIDDAFRQEMNDLFDKYECGKFGTVGEFMRIIREWLDR